MSEHWKTRTPTPEFEAFQGVLLAFAAKLKQMGVGLTSVSVARLPRVDADRENEDTTVQLLTPIGVIVVRQENPA